MLLSQLPHLGRVPLVTAGCLACMLCYSCIALVLSIIAGTTNSVSYDIGPGAWHCGAAWHQMQL